MTANKELKPCPFCGGDMWNMLNPYYFQSVAFIKCKNCGAIVSFDGKESMPQAINAWNRREIKFRGFHRDENGKEKVYVNGEWIKGYWVYGVPASSYMITTVKAVEYQKNAECAYVSFDYVTIIPETVGQYTGLKDKNGKEIFEGDIVKFFGMKGEITRECGAFGIGTSKQINYDALENEVPFSNEPMFCYNDNFISLWELWWNFEQDDNPLYEVEVVGNIYENPELLEVQ